MPSGAEGAIRLPPVRKLQLVDYDGVLRGIWKVQVSMGCPDVEDVSASGQLQRRRLGKVAAAGAASNQIAALSVRSQCSRRSA